MSPKLSGLKQQSFNYTLCESIFWAMFGWVILGFKVYQVEAAQWYSAAVWYSLKGSESFAYMHAETSTVIARKVGFAGILFFYLWLQSLSLWSVQLECLILTWPTRQTSVHRVSKESCKTTCDLNTCDLSTKIQENYLCHILLAKQKPTWFKAKGITLHLSIGRIVKNYCRR